MIQYVRCCVLASPRNVHVMQDMAHEEKEKYKEGKYILEQELLCQVN